MPPTLKSAFMTDTDQDSEIAAMIGGAIAGFIEARHSPARVRMLLKDPTGYDRAVWTHMAEEGWLTARLPEGSGGVGLSLTTTASMVRAFGGALLPEPLIACAFMPSAILASCGSDALLSDLMSGQHLATLAWQESIAQTAPAPPTTRLESAQDGYRLNGRKLNVPHGATCDILLVSALHGDGATAIVTVQAGAAGITVTPHDHREGGRFASLDFVDVEIPGDALLLVGEAADRALDQAITEGTVLLSAYLAGMSEKILEIATDYARTREQFGRVIGSFQALQHKLVDLAMRVRLTTATIDHATRALDRDLPSADAAVAAAKASSAGTAFLVSRKAIQILGAIGYTQEADAGLYLTAAIGLTPWLGGERHQRRRFATLALTKDD